MWARSRVWLALSPYGLIPWWAAVIILKEMRRKCCTTIYMVLRQPPISLERARDPYLRAVWFLQVEEQMKAILIRWLYLFPWDNVGYVFLLQGGVLIINLLFLSETHPPNKKEELLQETKITLLSFLLDKRGRESARKYRRSVNLTLIFPRTTSHLSHTLTTSHVFLTFFSHIPPLF